jgi:hypothetical protein
MRKNFSARAEKVTNRDKRERVAKKKILRRPKHEGKRFVRRFGWG